MLTVAECEGGQSEVLHIPIDWAKSTDEEKIDPLKPAIWNRKHENPLTMESYAFMDRMTRHQAKASGLRISVTGDRWAELSLHELVEL